MRADDPRWDLPPLPVQVSGYEYPGRSLLWLVLVVLVMVAAILGGGCYLVVARTPSLRITGASDVGESKAFAVNEEYAISMGRYVFDLMHTWNAQTLDQRLATLVNVLDQRGGNLIRQRYEPRKKAASALDLSQLGTLTSIRAVRVDATHWQVSWTGQVQTFYGVAAGDTTLLHESATFVVTPPTALRPTFLVVTALATTPETVAAVPAVLPITPPPIVSPSATSGAILP